jgi:hypothetical protein
MLKLMTHVICCRFTLGNVDVQDIRLISLVAAVRISE